MFTVSNGGVCGGRDGVSSDGVLMMCEVRGSGDRFGMVQRGLPSVWFDDISTYNTSISLSIP
jgi:hypothetical protein